MTSEAGPGEPVGARALRRALLLDDRRFAELRRRQRGVQPRRLPVPRAPSDAREPGSEDEGREPTAAAAGRPRS